MNVAKQESIQTNSLPFLKKLIGLMTPVWNQLRDRPRLTYPVGYQPTDPLQRLAYWTAIRDGADEQIVTAGAAARDAEHTWHAIGMAYGDRTAQAAFKRFGNA